MKKSSEVFLRHFFGLKHCGSYLILLKLNGSHRPSENTRHKKASKRPVLICIRENALLLDARSI